jgi:hypothetical protein
MLKVEVAAAAGRDNTGCFRQLSVLPLQRPKGLNASVAVDIEPETLDTILRNGEITLLERDAYGWRLRPEPVEVKLYTVVRAYHRVATHKPP